jgi:hypothetical protein
VGDSPDEAKRDSSMQIDFTLSIGYKRRRPDTQGDRWEARVDTLGLLIIGAIVTLIILIFLVPRILTAVGIM